MSCIFMYGIFMSCNLLVIFTSCNFTPCKCHGLSFSTSSIFSQPMLIWNICMTQFLAYALSDGSEIMRISAPCHKIWAPWSSKNVGLGTNNVCIIFFRFLACILPFWSTFGVQNFGRGVTHSRDMVKNGVCYKTYIFNTAPINAQRPVPVWHRLSHVFLQTVCTGTFTQYVWNVAQMRPFNCISRKCPLYQFFRSLGIMLPSWARPAKVSLCCMHTSSW